IVLSHDTWLRRFGGDSSVIGHRLSNPYTRTLYTIIGVAPAGLGYPVGTEYWAPFVYKSSLNVVARLVPGATPEGARAEFLAVMRDVLKQGGIVEPPGAAHVRTLPDVVVGDVRPALRVLMAAVALLLIIACVNVGNLLLLRSSARGREFAVRRSL